MMKLLMLANEHTTMSTKPEAPLDQQQMREQNNELCYFTFRAESQQHTYVLRMSTGFKR